MRLAYQNAPRFAIIAPQRNQANADEMAGSSNLAPVASSAARGGVVQRGESRLSVNVEVTEAGELPVAT